MSTHKDRIIEQQQRTIAKYERTLNEIRATVEKAMVEKVPPGNRDLMTDAIGRRIPFSITRFKEPAAAVLPVEVLVKLGVISE